MSEIEVWGTGKPLQGFSEDDVLTNARTLFPSVPSARIAQFIAGKPFVIARVNDEDEAKRTIETMAKSGIAAQTASSPATAVPAAAPVAALKLAEDPPLELKLVDDPSPALKLADAPPPPPSSAPPRESVAAAKQPLRVDSAPKAPAPREPAPEELDVKESTSEDAALSPRTPAGAAGQRKKRTFAIAAAGILVVAVVAVVAVQRNRAEERELAARTMAEAKALADQATQREAETQARKRAEEDAAEKANAAAAEALRLQKKEAAASDVSQAFAAGNYPETIARSERFDVTYGPDPRIQKLESDATYNLKEAARHGNFAAILNAPANGSARFAQLREWALKVQEHAKPVIVEARP